MRVYTIQRKVALTVENDVVRNDDCGARQHYVLWAIALKRVGPAACGNRVADALLRTWEKRVRQLTRAGLTHASGTWRSVGYGRSGARPVRRIAHLRRTIVEVVTVHRQVNTPAPPKIAEEAGVGGAQIAVVAIGVLVALDDTSRAAASAIAASLTAPNQGHQPKRADAQKSK
jgi:hypothetical protein